MTTKYNDAVTVMAFRRGKVDFLQTERERLPKHRPVIIYITAPLTSKDFGQRTSQYKHFKPDDASLPAGVLKRDVYPINCALVEADHTMDRFDEQVVACLEQYKEAAHKVVVLNAHANAEGVLLHDDGKENGEKLVLTGRHLAEVLSRHTHKHHLHVIAVTSYGHKFAEEFYNYVTYSTQSEVQSFMAISFFTTESSPTAWNHVSTSGNGHVEVTREVGEFIRSNIEPNSPYKMLDSQVAKSHCVIL